MASYRHLLWALVLCAGPASAQEPDVSSSKRILGETVNREDFAAFQSHLARIASPTGEPARPDALSVLTTWPQPVQYERGTASVPASAAQLQAALGRTRTLVMSNAYEQLQLETAFVPLVNLEGVVPEVRILSLKNEKGRPVAFTPRPAAPLEGGRLISALVLAPGTDTRGFARWTGSAEVTLAVPVGHETVRLDASAVGQTKKGFTLDAWGPRVQVHYTPVAGREPSFLAVADNGLALAPLEATRLSLEERELARSLSTLAWEDVPEVTDVPEGEGPVALTWDFGAAPRALDIFVPGKPVKRSVRVALVVESASTRPGLLEEVAVAPRWCGLEAPALTAALRVEATRARGESAFGAPLLYAQLPACDEGAFAEVRFEALRFFSGAGTELTDVARDERGYQAASFTVPVSLSQPQAPLPVDPAFRKLGRVRGTLQVRWPRVRTVELTPASPRAGGVRVTFAGKKLTLEQDAAHRTALLAPADMTPTWLRENPLATGAEGQILLARPGQATEGPTSTTQELLFDAPPTKLRLLSAAGFLDVALPFDVELPPPPPPRTRE